MHVVARQLQRRGIAQPHDGRLGRAAHQRQAELAVHEAGRGLGVRVRVDAGRDAQHDRLPDPARRRDALQPVEFVLVVDDDPPDARVDGRGQLGGALVVAVERHPVGREAPGPRDVQLAAGDDVHADVLLGQQGGQGGVQEGLGGVEDARAGQPLAEFAAVVAADLADGRFVVQVERRAVLAAERHDVAAGQAQMPGAVDHGRDREQVARTGGDGLQRSLAHGGRLASRDGRARPADAPHRPGGRSGRRCRLQAAPRSPPRRSAPSVYGSGAATVHARPRGGARPSTLDDVPALVE